MWSVKRRIGAGFALLMLLFLAVVTVQLYVTDHLQVEQTGRAARIDRALEANREVLQHMTDAETGVRGLQLTGDKLFLTPYDSGRAGAYNAFDRIATLSGDDKVHRLLVAEREAASRWLNAYAVPIVNAGVADRSEPRAAQGKEMFDRIRRANAAVDEALRTEQRTTAAADERTSRYAQLVFAGLTVAFLVAALALATMYHRQLLGPLEHIRAILGRLADGDRSARADPAGPAEMRAVAVTLNGLAAQTERLLDAEHARAARSELRQAVAAALQEEHDPAATAARVAELIGRALHADAVYGRVTVDAGAGADVCWPAGAAPLPPAVLSRAAGAAGQVLPVPEVPGAVVVGLSGDHECPPGLLAVIRSGETRWRPEERRLLAALGREIDHAARRERLRLRQVRLIGELRRLDERKDAFVSTVTHELRTPLTSILGYTEMLGDGDGGDLSPLQRRGVAAILRNAERLRDTVANLLLLDHSATRVSGTAIPVELAAVAAGVAAESDAHARAKGVVVSMNVTPVWVDGDARQLERALRNLVDNAIKFTEPGGLVACRIARDGDQVRIEVRDTGIGIPADDLAGLFTPFHRGSNAMDRAVQGPGLGLAIVQNIVSEHGGTVAVRSVVAEGSTVTVTLPVLTPAPAPDVPAVEPADAAT
jgi:two-component system phosphate regulon sensor histidine kinase PhoR